MSRLRVLAIAYACDPARGSEYGVGWGWVNAITADHDVTVITADFNAATIQNYLANQGDDGCPHPRFVYVKNRPWHYRPSKLWLKIEESLAKPLMNLSYQDWLRCAFDEAKRELKQNHYDLVHLITFVGWRFPGKFYRLDLPFVWGPIGGMKNTPWKLLPIFGLRGAIYYAGRNLINSLQLHVLRGPRRALKAADRGVIAATSEIQKELWKRFRTKSRVVCEVGPPSVGAPKQMRRESSEPLRICWSGQHLPGKALPLLLHAAAKLPKDVDYRIEILGDGPFRKSWQSAASRLGIHEVCSWHGWIDRNRSLDVMRASHVFVITSLKDLTSTVAVEAISLGLPVIALDHCGFADLVTSACGLKIHPGSERQIVKDLAESIERLYRDEPLRARLSDGALARSRDYSWRAKMDILHEIYQTATRASAVKALQEVPEPLVTVANEHTP